MSDEHLALLNPVDLAQRARARVGTTLRGKYRIDAVIGIGGMAVVYAATHRNAKRFAVKVLHPELSFSEDIRTRFMREGYAANSVGHTATVAVLDDDVAEDGAAFIVMELLDGVGADMLWESQGRRLSPRAAVAIVDQLLDVLSAAHARGIVHRDIKPGNLFVTRDGTLKVLDFGIARVRDAAANSSGVGTGAGTLLGTPAFMAPEQALAKLAEIDAQTDVWAASATLFTLVSGELVHPGDNSAQILVRAATERARSVAVVAPDLPPAIAQVVDGGLAFDKARRWPSAAAMREALREAHRTAYGDLPGRVPLEGVMLGSRFETWAAPATADLPAAVRPSSGSPWRTATATPDPALGSGTTARPIQTSGIAAVSPPRRLAFWVGLASAAVLFAVAATWSLRLSKATPSDAARASQAAAPTAPGTMSALALPVPAPASSMPAPPPEPSTVAGPQVPAASAPTAFPSPTAAPASPDRRPPAVVRPAARALAPSPSPVSAPVSCSPPFFYDSSGNRVYKEECVGK